MEMPRAKDPELNFNWVNIFTVFPGAAAVDVEKRVTEPLEDALRRSVRDIKFVNSTSRDNVSMILVRFNQIDQEKIRQADDRPAARSPEYLYR